MLPKCGDIDRISGIESGGCMWTSAGLADVVSTVMAVVVSKVMPV